MSTLIINVTESCGVMYKLKPYNPDVPLGAGESPYELVPVPRHYCQVINESEINVNPESKPTIITAPNVTSFIKDEYRHIFLNGGSLSEFKVEQNALGFDFIVKEDYDIDFNNMDPENPPTFIQKTWTVTLPKITANSGSGSTRNITFEKDMTVTFTEHLVSVFGFSVVNTIKNFVVSPYKLPQARHALAHFINNGKNFLDTTYDPMLAHQTPEKWFMEIEQAEAVNRLKYGMSVDEDGSLYITGLTSMGATLPPGSISIEYPGLAGAYAVKITESGLVDFIVEPKFAASVAPDTQDEEESLLASRRYYSQLPTPTLGALQRAQEFDESFLLTAAGGLGQPLEITLSTVPGWLRVNNLLGYIVPKEDADLSGKTGFTHLIPFFEGALVINAQVVDIPADESNTGDPVQLIELESLGSYEGGAAWFEYGDLPNGDYIWSILVNSGWSEFSANIPINIPENPSHVFARYLEHQVSGDIELDLGTDAPVIIFPADRDITQQEFDDIANDVGKMIPGRPAETGLPDAVFFMGEWRLSGNVSVDDMEWVKSTDKLSVSTALAPTGMKLVTFSEIMQGAILPEVIYKNSFDVYFTAENGMRYPMWLYYNVDYDGIGGAPALPPGKKITELDPVASLTGTEKMMAVQDGSSKVLTISQLHDYLISE